MMYRCGGCFTLIDREELRDRDIVTYAKYKSVCPRCQSRLLFKIRTEVIRRHKAR